MFLEVNNTLEINLDKYEKLFTNLANKTFKVLKLNDNFIISVTFVDKETIHKINKDYRGIDRPTDVISFAFLDDKNEKIIGDIPTDLGELYICYEVADENRLNYNNSIEREICFLFVHGLLHLLGYDHMVEEDEKEMFSLQDEIFKGEILMDKEKLIDEAIKARKNSYSPYSKFKVGAVVLTNDNKLYYGANIENSSYPLAMCAERNALFNAYSNGVRKDDIIALCIVADCKRPVSPCGACRQVISELCNKDTKIILTNLKKEVKEVTIDDLLPYSFDSNDME